MDVLHVVAPLLLALVGYSSGSVLAAGRKPVSPGPADLVAVAVLWGAVLFLAPGLGWGGAIAAALGAGLATGGGASALRRGEAEPRFHGPQEADGPGGAWAGWKRFARRMGNFQARMVMGFFYFGAVPLFALLARLQGSGGAGGTSGSFWLPRPPASVELARARSQF